jgi:diacylglycerol kinase family enzyme
LLLTNRLPRAAVVRLRGRSFSLIAQAATRFEVDGELGGTLPAQLGVQPGALRVLAS